MGSTVLHFYAQHDRFTDPAEHGDLLDALPTDLAELHAALNELLIHVWKMEAYHPQLLEYPREVWVRQSRRVIERLLALDDRPLNVGRPVEKRAMIDCRHFSTFLCTVLRHRGIPARPRCGFGTYLEAGGAMDHWICEYWSADQNRWVMEDADLKLHGVPPDQFITGARAWQICRETPDQANTFMFAADTRGASVARCNLVRDFAALNGFVSVSGDAWGLGRKEEADLTLDDVALLDRAAALAITDDALDERRVFYDASEGLRAPALIPHFDYFTAQEWQMIDWQREP